jgi:hypothetical protein
MPSDPNDEPEGPEPSDGADYSSGQPRFDLRSAFIARQEQLLADLGLSLNPPISSLEPLVWPGKRPISAAEVVHLRGATPSEFQRALDLRGRRRAHGVAVDSG